MTHAHPTSIPLPILLYLDTGSHQVAQIGLVCGKLAAVASDVNLSTFFWQERVSTSLDLLDIYISSSVKR